MTSIKNTSAWAMMERRRVLAGMGLGAVTMALPPLEALGQTLPKKLVLFHFGNGVPLDYWKPLTLPREALGDMMPRCTVVRGLSTTEFARPMIEQGANGHFAGMSTVLTCKAGIPDPGDAYFGHKFKAGGESFDQAIAGIFNGGRPVPNWAGWLRENAPKESYLSYTKTGGRLALSSTLGILTAFPNIKTNSTPVPVDATAKLRRERIMNSLKLQGDLVKAKVGTEDRLRVDQYLSSMSQLDTALAASDPTGPASNCGSLNITGYTGALSENHLNNLFELSFRALECDVTNILIFSIINPGQGPALTTLGINDTRLEHAVSHHANDPTLKEPHRLATLWKAQHFANFLRKLSSEKGPDGTTLLDRSAVVYFSEMGEGSAHGTTDIATIAAGGAFKKPTGNVIDVNGAPMANMWMTAMRAVGISSTQMPRWGNSTGTINQLLA